jgi:hypothetical protein
MICRLKQERGLAYARLAPHKDRCTRNDPAAKHSIELTQADRTTIRRVEPLTSCAHNFDGRLPSVAIESILFAESFLFSALRAESHPSR